MPFFGPRVEMLDHNPSIANALEKGGKSYKKLKLENGIKRIIRNTYYNQINRSKKKRTWVCIWLNFANDFTKNNLFEIWKRKKKFRREEIFET